VGGVVRGLLLGTTRLASGETVQRLVDEVTGNLVDRTLSTAGRVVSERVTGSVLNLPVLRETTNTAGQVIRQVRDQAGAVIEYTLDRATNRLAGIRVLQAAR
jgi:YD repeat-containing protein